MQGGLRYVPLGYQQITDVSSVQRLTPPAGATFALITSTAQGVRWTDLGNAPTSTTGMPLAAGTVLEYSGNLSAISFIEDTAGAILNVAYYRVAG